MNINQIRSFIPPVYDSVESTASNSDSTVKKINLFIQSDAPVALPLSPPSSSVKFLTLTKSSSLENIKGGEVGFIYAPKDLKLTRQVIRASQRLFTCPDGENYQFVHAMIVLGKLPGSEYHILVAEANSKGLKEMLIDVRHLANDEEIHLYQEENEEFRKKLIEHAKFSIDLIPLGTEKDYGGNVNYLKIMNYYIKNNGLYNYKSAIKVIGNNVEWGPKAEFRIARAAADFLSGTFLTNKKGERKALICSSFVALTYQATKLLQAIDSTTLQRIQKLSYEEKIEVLLGELDRLKNLAFLEFQKYTLDLDPQRVTPAFLEHRFKLLSET